jgi:hypothetical protein
LDGKIGDDFTSKIIWLGYFMKNYKRKNVVLKVPKGRGVVTVRFLKKVLSLIVWFNTLVAYVSKNWEWNFVK